MSAQSILLPTVEGLEKSHQVCLVLLNLKLDPQDNSQAPEKNNVVARMADQI